jgi:hypothetical protein
MMGNFSSAPRVQESIDFDFKNSDPQCDLSLSGRIASCLSLVCLLDEIVYKGLGNIFQTEFIGHFTV